jgi:hypothetical protein
LALESDIGMANGPVVVTTATGLSSIEPLDDPSGQAIS